MYKRIITLGIFVLIGFFIFVVYEPLANLVAAAPTATGTIAYVLPNDTTGNEIWLIEPNGSNNRRIYSTGKADPYAVDGISGLAWRPDAGEVIFSSNHERDCSWYASDLYAILANGNGYRRVTNAPACAALANYPKGTVVVSVPATDSFAQVYIQGAPMLKTIPPGGGVITFDNVADLGNVLQPVVVISGKYRYMTDVAVDVQAGQTVNAGVVSLTTGGISALGAYGPSWRSDGSRIGYVFGCIQPYGIADQPPAGNTGQPLFNASGVTPCVMAWGSTASTANQIVYYNTTGDVGIYRTTDGSPNAGTRLVANISDDAVNFVLSLQYLPDASGILFSIPDNWGNSANIYRYDFASDTVTKLTFYTDQYARDFAISPDGQTVIFELADPVWTELYGGPSDLWTMRIDGSNQQLFKADGAHPSWIASTTTTPTLTPTSTRTSTPTPTWTPPPPSGSSSKVHLPFVQR